jgi:hypothetical protein
VTILAFFADCGGGGVDGDERDDEQLGGECGGKGEAEGLGRELAHMEERDEHQPEGGAHDEEDPACEHFARAAVAARGLAPGDWVLPDGARGPRAARLGVGDCLLATTELAPDGDSIVALAQGLQAARADGDCAGDHEEDRNNNRAHTPEGDGLLEHPACEARVRARGGARIGCWVEEGLQREEGVEARHERDAPGALAQQEVDCEGDGEVGHDSDVKDEEGSLAHKARHAEGDRGRAHEQRGASGDEIAREDGRAWDAPKVLRDGKQRQRAGEQSEHKEKATKEIAQHDLPGCERSREDDFPVFRVGFLRDCTAHEHGRKGADERDLQIGDCGEARGTGGGEVLVAQAAAGVEQQRPEEDDDEGSEVRAADVHVLAASPAVMDEAHGDGIGEQQALEVLEEDWHGASVEGRAACGGCLRRVLRSRCRPRGR